ncbi:rhomboid family intramembrane serine protease [Methanococcoides sp. AM1]|uniref:rhomboid family intramembrane serine protease n=1 Tax=Methanococcoides sp. AM1 TaxID=1201011 RepID=UPI001082F45F|nr:rhomboid family intramembrane serine protease [Methanococcoides sp. AM1]
MSIGLKEEISKFHFLNVNWKDLDIFLLFLFIPSLLLMLFFLPDYMKLDHFILFPLEPKIETLFLSNYIHSSYSHLMKNLVFYLVLMFLIINFETDRNFFIISFLLFSFVLPFIVSFSMVYFIDLPFPVQGYSGIISALVAYLMFAFYRYCKKYYCPKIGHEFVYFLIFLNLFLVLFNLKASIFMYLGISILLLVTAYANRPFFDCISLKLHSFCGSGIKHVSSSFILIYIALIYLILVYFLIGLPLLIPENIVNETGIVNSLGHYTGYIFGLMSALMLEQANKII